MMGCELPDGQVAQKTDFLSNLPPVAYESDMIIGTFAAFSPHMHQNIMRNINPIAIVTLAILAFPVVSMADTYTREDSQEFSAESVQKVDLQAYAADVSVTGWDQPVVKIDIQLQTKADSQEEADKVFDETEISLVEKAGVLEVAVKTKGRKNKSFFGLFSSSKAPRASIAVFIPDNMEISAKTGSGDVELEGVSGTASVNSGSGTVSGSNLAGEIKATTGSGDIELESLVGNIVARTGSGSVRIDDISGSLDAATGSGGIRAKGQFGQFVAKTGSGSIRLETSTGLQDDCKAATGSGGIDILLPASAGFQLDAGTGSGSVSCDFDLVDPVVKKRSLEGSTSVPGPRLKLSTGSGSITVSQR